MGVLDDVSVVELSIAIAAPSCGRMLAYHGADVAKIESRTSPDVARLFGSAWAAGIEQGPYQDSSPYLAEMSANKRSVGLELKRPAAREAALRLLATADVFVTNYSTPAVRALGLGYDDVVAVNPSIVYVALPGFGSDSTQPYYEFLAWGPNQAPLVGLDEMTGHPDQIPAGIATISPPDYFAGLHALTAVLSALEHRDRSGEGSFIDVAQFDTTVSCLGPFLLDHALTGHVGTRTGNRLEWLAPQGVYPCVGDDRWVALTVADDRQWLALAELLGDEAHGEE
jgi:benzylsuccinate CoA-transferase BbsF subunit